MVTTRSSLRRTTVPDGARAMDTTRFDSLIRFVSASTSRRSTLRGLIAGTAATVTGAGLLQADEVAAGKKNKKRNKRKKDQTPPQPENVCAAKNWCVDRSQTCGPAGGHGKCLVES